MWKTLAAVLLCVTPSTLWAAEPEPSLSIREARNGQLVFKTRQSTFKHYFAVIAGSVTPATITDMNVARFSDDTGTQVKAEAHWQGGKQPQTIDLGNRGEILVEATFPRPGVYKTEIEVIYNGKFLRVPLQVESGVAADPETIHELAIDAGTGPILERTYYFGSGVPVDIPLRGTRLEGTAVSWGKVISLRRKGANGQLIDADASGGEDLFPHRQPITVSKTEPSKVSVELAGIDRPGTYEGKALLGHASPATQEAPAVNAIRELPFTIIVKRSWIFAITLISIGVLISFGVRRWLQRGRARATILRDLSRLQAALAAVDKDALGEVEKRVLDEIARQLAELHQKLGDGDEVAEGTVELLRRHIRLLQAVVEARKLIALFPPDKRKTLAPKLDSIATALCRPLKDADLVQQDEALRKLDLDKELRSALEELVTSLERRLSNREHMHPGLADSWSVVRKSLKSVKAGLAENKVRVTQAQLAVAYADFVKALGTVLRAAIETAPPRVPEPDWESAKADITRLLDELDRSQDAEERNELHARALSCFLYTAAPALLWTVDREGNKRPAQKAEFDALRVRAEALRTGSDPDADDQYQLLCRELNKLIDAAPVPDDDEHEVGAPASRGMPMLDSASKGASPLAALRPVLPDAAWVSARIQLADRATDWILLALAVLTGLKLLWMPSTTWGGEEDLLTAFLWGAGVHSVGQGAARGIMGLMKDFAKPD